jgi:putative FmdB family regulatory protein
VPTYDYQCRSCGSVTEVIHSMLADGPSVCERCGGELRRVLYPTGIIFKGSGFYRTDSRGTDTRGTDTRGSSSSSTETKTTTGDSTSSAEAKPKPSSGEGKKKTASSDSAA